MGVFGSYETAEEISVGPLTAVYAARRLGESGPPKYAVKVLEFSRLLSEARDPSALVSRFLASAEAQRAAACGSAHWAPVHAMGEFDGGAYYVSDHFEHSLQRLIRGRVELTGPRLHSLISQMIGGLVDLRKIAGRAHGNLKGCNVLLRSNRMELAGSVLLSDPLSEALNSPSHSVADVEAVGKLLYWLVTGREFNFRTPLPIEATPEWAKLGRTGAKWRWLCGRMLDPNPSQDLSPEWVSQQLAHWRQGRPSAALIGTAAAAVLAVAAVPWAVHHQRAREASTNSSPVVLKNTSSDPGGSTKDNGTGTLPGGDVLHRLMDAENPAESFKLRVVPKIRSEGGEQLMTLSVTADSDCRVMVLTRDSQGEVSLLVPNTRIEAPSVLAGVPVEIPAPGAECVFPLAPPWGPTVIKVIGTRKPIDVRSSGAGSLLYTGITALRVSGTNQQGTELSALLSGGDWSTGRAEFVSHPADGSSTKIDAGGQLRQGAH